MSVAAPYPLLLDHAVGENAAMEAVPTNVDPPKRKRRWYQFSLHSLMIGVTLLILPVCWLGYRPLFVLRTSCLK